MTKYDVFLSHSSSDEAAAGAVHRALRRFAKRWLAVRALRVFRYVTSMSADPELWESLKNAMHESRFLVLLASPSSAASTYVLREMDEWIRQGKGNQLLILLLDGSIVWNPERSDFDWERTTALSPALAKRIPAEPRYVDLTKVARDSYTLRNPAFKDAIATIAAPVHGRSKDELVGDDLHHGKCGRSPLVLR